MSVQNCSLWQQLLRNPDLPLAQPTTPTPLHLFASSRTDLFDHQALVTLLAAAAPQSVSPCSQRAAASDGSPPTTANNNVHASPAVHPSSPAAAANWSATSSRFAWATPAAATNCPSCRPASFSASRTWFERKR